MRNVDLKLLVIALFLFSALSHWFVAPIFEIYDEGAHVGYVYYLRTHRRLPVYDRGTPWQQQPYGQESAQPPLYYLVEALLSAPISMGDFEEVWKINPHAKVGIPKATDNHNLFLHDPGKERLPWEGTVLAVHVMRLLSVVMATWTLLLVYELARLLSRGNETVALMSMGLVAFNPAFSHIAAGVDNDWFVVPLATLAVLAMVERILSEERPTLRSSMWIGVVIGLAVLSKVSGLLLLPLVAIMLTFEFVLHRVRMKELMVHLVVVIGIVTALAGWWFVRNYVVYGDPLATVVHIWRWGTAPHRSIWDVVLHESEGIWIYFWGVFGLGTIILPDIALKWIDAVAVLCLLGMVLETVSLSRRGCRREGKDVAAWILVLLWGVSMLVALVRWTLIVPASQGRLLYPAIGSFAAMGGAGLYGWRKLLPGKAFSVIVLMTLGGMGVISVFTPWLIVKPAYMPPPHGLEVKLPPGITSSRVSFGGYIEVIGYDARLCNSETSEQVLKVRNGDRVCVTLILRGERRMRKDYSLSIQVVPPSVPPLAAQLDTYPGGGTMPTSTWENGEVIMDRYKVKVNYPVDHPTEGTLQVVFYDFNTKRRLTAIDLPSGGELWDDAMVLKRVLILPDGTHSH